MSRSVWILTVVVLPFTVVRSHGYRNVANAVFVRVAPTALHRVRRVTCKCIPIITYSKKRNLSGTILK